MKRPKEFSPPSNPGELVIAVVSAILLILVMASLGGCISKLSGPEPKWAPTLYNVIPDDKKKYLCTEADNFTLLIEKFNACEVWK